MYILILLVHVHSSPLYVRCVQCFTIGVYHFVDLFVFYVNILFSFFVILGLAWFTYQNTLK
jgi:hypothetical protein